MIILKNLSISFDDYIYVQRQDLSFPLGSFVGIYGESGCGKTSLLNILSMQAEREDIEYSINGLVVNSLSRKEQREYCLNHISYLTQESRFISGLTCYDILKLAALSTNQDSSDERINNVLEEISLEINPKLYPNELSGGQRQLLSIGEALMKGSDILLCDETTSSLDNHYKQIIMDVLRNLVENENKTVIMVTHDQDIYELFDVLYAFRDNKIILERGEVKEIEVPIEEKHAKSKGTRLMTKAYFKSTSKSKAIFCLLLSICIALVSVGYKYAYQIYDHLDYFRKNAAPYEYFLYEDNDYYPSTIMDLSTRNIDEEVLDQIEDLSGIESIDEYPIFMIDYGYYDQSDQYHSVLDCYDMVLDGNEFTLETLNTDENDYVLSATTYQIKSYDDLEYMDEYCSSSINPTGEIYLSSSMAMDMGIEDVHEGMTLSFNCLVPVGYSDITMEENTYYVQYEMVTIDTQIRGILDSYYLHFSYTSCIYMDLDIMKEIQEQYMSSEDMFYNPVYKIYVSDDADIEELEEELAEILPDLTLYNRTNEYLILVEPILNTDDTTKVFFYVMLGIVGLMSLVYSYMQYRQDKKFFSIPASRGMDHSVLRASLALNIIMEILIVLIASLLITMLFYQIGVDGGFLKELAEASAKEKEVYMISMAGAIIAVPVTYIITLINLMIRGHFQSSNKK